MIECIPEKLKKEIKKAKGHIYVVGGYVRDQILGMPSKDIDLVITGVRYQDLCKILEKYGKLDEVGKSFGVIKWKLPELEEAIDVALPRVEVSTGDAHKDFDVHFDHTLSIEEDLKRRDFTMNAIAMDLMTGKIIDPFLGAIHLDAKAIRTVTEDSFKDDPLRMLRAIQFMARFSLTDSYYISKELNENAHRIKHISKDRIAVELGKLFGKGTNLKPALSLMKNVGLWGRIFTEIDCDPALMSSIPKCIDLRFSTLFSHGKLTYFGRSRVEVAEETIDELKLTAAGLDKNRVLMLVANSNPIEALNPTSNVKDVVKVLRKLISKKLKGNPMNFYDLAIIWSKSIPNGISASDWSTMLINTCRMVAGIERANHPLSLKDLAVNGNDVQIEVGLKGKEIGDALKECLDIVLEEPSLNTRERLLFTCHEFAKK